ncbi:MAG: zinc ribbon domain-containing protein [Planctomycetota bacterium]|nr:zinc ribbon domain-containing protein [Planctomycetota bacterium]
MMRWFTRIIVVILLGAIVNVAIACYLAYRADYTQFSSQGWQAIKHSEPLIVNKEDKLGVTFVGSVFYSRNSDQFFEIHEVVPSWSLRYRDETPLFQQTKANSFEMASGWPLRSFKAAYLYVGTIPRAGKVIYGYELEPIPRVRMIPTKPIWMGFFGNTAVWAILLGMTWFLGKTSLHLVRRRKGRCQKCGYDLRGAEHNRCPECGTMIRVNFPSRETES